MSVPGYEEFPKEIFLRAPATSDLVYWCFTYIKIIHKAPKSSRLFFGLVLKAMQQTIVLCVKHVQFRPVLRRDYAPLRGEMLSTRF